MKFMRHFKQLRARKPSGIWWGIAIVAIFLGIEALLRKDEGIGSWIFVLFLWVVAYKVSAEARHDLWGVTKKLWVSYEPGDSRASRQTLLDGVRALWHSYEPGGSRSVLNGPKTA
jgi:uncharacterized membrane protein YfcA